MKTKLLTALFAILFALPLFATDREMLIDNDEVKVWKTTITPGFPLSMHRHDKPRVVVGLKGGTLTKIMDNGSTSQLIFETGKSYWMDADPEGELHGDVNNGNENIEVLVIELQ